MFIQSYLDGCDSSEPEVEFNYADCDSPANEIAQLYSYTEIPEFQHNLKVGELVCLNVVSAFHQFLQIVAEETI
jgi:hypothetical protein